MATKKVRELSAKMDQGMSSGFEKLANVVTTYPVVTMLATLVLAFALSPGMGMGKTELNGENLWTPQDTESKDQQKWVLDTFGSGDRRVRAYSVNGGSNVLTAEGLAALEDLHTGILGVTAKCEAGSCDGKTIAYNQVRAQQRRSVLSIWGDSAPASGVDFLADVNNEAKWLTTDGQKLKLADMLGGVTRDSTGKIIGAEAFLTTIYLQNDREDVDDTDTDPASEAWELEFDDYVTGFSSPALSKNYPWTRKGQSEAGGSAIRGDLGMLSTGYVLLIVFSVIVMSKDKQVHSNGAMAFASLLSVGLSIVSTFGLCGLVGVKQNPVTSTLYLVLLGIGVDDSYVIMGEYTRTKGTPKERVVKALTKAGTSIAVTSTTDIIAFAAGVSSSLPALADFCIFASIGILFDFFYQCTFFCALLTFRARGTESNRPDWLCCIKVDPEATGCFGCSAPICSRKGKCVCCPCSWEGEDGESNSVTRSLLNKLTKFTLSPVGNGVVAVVTVGLLAGGVAGIPNLKRDFDIKWFTPDDDAYTETFDIADQYFPTLGGLPVYVYTKEGSYSQAHSDGSLSTLYQSAQSCSWVESTVGNWYTDFTTDAVRSNNAKASDAAFASEVYSFINSVAGARFQGDVMFNKDSTGNVVSVDGTKAMYIAKPTKNGGEDIEMMNAVRDCVDGKALSSFPFNSPFLYFDGLAVVDTECIQNVVIACACVFVVALILLADLFAALLVLLMIGLVDICILGYMAHWELDFNSVTAINLVLAVGLAVDYAAHIMHKFLVMHGSGAERAMQAVDHIGASVFNGAFSTFLAVLPLGLSKSYVFQVFFKMWFMIIVFGVYFGVVVLPVLLKFASPIIGAQEPNVYETSTPTGSSVKPGDSEVNEATSKDGHYIGKPQDDPVTVSIR